MKRIKKTTGNKTISKKDSYQNINQTHFHSISIYYCFLCSEDYQTKFFRRAVYLEGIASKRQKGLFFASSLCNRVMSEQKWHLGGNI